MTAQKGPGEGYMSAKDEALALAPDLVCRQMRHGSDVFGYRVSHKGGQPLPWAADMSSRYGDGGSARDAWGSALDYLRRAQPLR